MMGVVMRTCIMAILEYAINSEKSLQWSQELNSNYLSVAKEI